MMIRILTLCCFTLCLMTSQAWAKGWEVRSENFILVTDDNQKSAEKIVQDLEEYRNVILGLWTTEPSREVQPIRVYAFKNSKTFTRVTGRSSKNIGGFYKSKREGPIFVLNWKGNNGDRENARQVALHEYTHHLLAQYSERIYPKWYTEGFCDYLSSLEHKEDQTYVLGRPLELRLNRLKTETWRPMPEILSAVKTYPFTLENRKDYSFIRKFYSQSWLSYTYIQSQPDLIRRTPKYLDLIALGTPALDAFQQAYDLTPDEFGARIRQFFKKGLYPSININVSKEIDPIPFKTRKVNSDEYEFLIAEAMNFYLSYGKQLPEKLAQYEKAQSLVGLTPDMIAGKVSVLGKMDAYDAAITLAASGLSKFPNHSKLNQVKGHALYGKASATKPLDKEVMAEARKHFKAAIIANPENMLAHYEYVRTFHALKDKPNKQAVASAKYVLSYYKALQFLGGNLTMAETLIVAGDYEAAKAPIEKAIIWAKNPKTVTRAKKLKARLETRQAKK